MIVYRSSRRQFFIGISALLIAPALVRASSIMPVRPQGVWLYCYGSSVVEGWYRKRPKLPAVTGAWLKWNEENTDPNVSIGGFEQVLWVGEPPRFTVADMRMAFDLVK